MRILTHMLKFNNAIKYIYCSFENYINKAWSKDPQLNIARTFYESTINRLPWNRYVVTENNKENLIINTFLVGILCSHLIKKTKNNAEMYSKRRRVSIKIQRVFFYLKQKITF